MKFHKKQDIKISINCAVRRNCPWVEGLVNSFLENTTDPDHVELILGIDHKDTTTRFFADNIKIMVLDQRAHKQDLWIYNNLMYEISRGKLLAEVADDFKISTPGWDALLTPYLVEAETKIFRVTTKPYEGGDFHPFYSRKYYEILGHMGIHDITSYNNTVFERLPPERTIHLDTILLQDRRVIGELNKNTMFKLPDGRMVDGCYGTIPNPDGTCDFGQEEGSIPNGWGWGKETQDQINLDVSILLNAIKGGV